jgi:SusD family.
MKKNKLYKFVVGLLCAVAMLSGCSEEFLKPDPLSLYEPTVTFSTESGLQAAMAFCDRQLKTNWLYYRAEINNTTPIGSDNLMSDMMIASKTDNANVFIDVATRLTPTSGLEQFTDGNGGNSEINKLGFFWTESYNGIKYANTVLSYIDKVKGMDESTRLAYKGRAYFHRSFYYMGLCFRFRDVPLVTKILQVPKMSYRSTKREAILKMLKQDMENAVQWVPDQKDMKYIGMINKGACRQLLIKIDLATGDYDGAIAQADALINNSGYSLMTNTFGTFVNPFPDTWNITRNVIWDLHRPQNKYIAANKEVILDMPNRDGSGDAQIKTNYMRNFLPFLDDNGTTDPAGARAVNYYAESDTKNFNIKYNYNKALGRGIGINAPTYFAQTGVWYVNGILDNGDLRHSVAVGNWVDPTALYYNNPKSASFGQHVQLYNASGKMLCNDTIRKWFGWPHYKIYMEDAVMNVPTQTQYNGGAGDLYFYRLAETYLLRAEAKYYKGDIAGATADVNTVRSRAHCTQLYSTVNIGSIMDERARELFLEEFRYAELSRVSYCLALSGKPDEWGNTYDVNTYDKDAGDDLGKNGGSYWWQRICHYNNYYNNPKAPVIQNRHFTMGKHNLYLPIYQQAIDANRKGKLSQNFGYTGYDANTPKWETWQEAVADEDITE